MYEVNCSECGQVGFHPSRVGAECQAERHETETAHAVSVGPMDGVSYN